MPSDWVKRYNFLLLSPNALSGGHFVENWVKWASTWSKPHNFAWNPILLDSAPLKYVKKSGSSALLKIAPTSSFFWYFPLVYSLCRHSFHSLSLLRYELNTYQSSRQLILILCLLCFFSSYPWVLCCVQSRLARIPRVQLTITISFTPSVRITYEWFEYTMNMLR